MPEIRLSVGSMSCRRCVRRVTGRLRDVVGVETVVADAETGTVVLSGTMSAADVLAALSGSGCSPRVVDDAAPTTS